MSRHSQPADEPGGSKREDGDEIPVLPPSLENIPDEERETFLAELQGYIAHFSGPLPHPQIMAGYEEVLPGSGERILRMTEETHRHRLAMEKESLRWANRSMFLGWTSSTVITILVLIGCFVLINQGQSVFGVAGVIVAAATLVATFLRSRGQKSAAN